MTLLPAPPHVLMAQAVTAAASPNTPAVVLNAAADVLCAFMHPDPNPASIARVCHEANRAYCQALGDDTQVSWDDAPEWQRTSAIEGVKMHLANPGATPEDSHNNWLKQKTADGWLYGPVKDPVAKTHPCIRYYKELSVEQRAKDHIFRAIVHALR